MEEGKQYILIKQRKQNSERKKNDNCFFRDPLFDGKNDAKQKKIVIL